MEIKCYKSHLRCDYRHNTIVDFGAEILQQNTVCSQFFLHLYSFFILLSRVPQMNGKSLVGVITYVLICKSFSLTLHKNFRVS